MMKNSKIEVKNLNKTIGSKRILKNISFTIEPEAHLVIIGGSVQASLCWQNAF